jgi:hypothetical protein
VVNFLRSIAVLAFSAQLASCSFFQKPTEGLAFHAPDGWSTMPMLPGGPAMWSRKRGPNIEMLSLTRLPGGEPLDKAPRPKGTVESRTITICGNQPARYFKAVGAATSGVSFTTEGVFTIVMGAGYLAAYYRPTAMPADAAAESALTTVCAAKT